MIGIYRIYNMITGQSYIGQSKDLMERFAQHLYHRSCNSTSSEIDKAIGYYGYWNFTFQILEFCSLKDLDWKEDWYIKYFGSNIYGYNINTGGQHGIGQANANHKINDNDIFYIRECYKNRQDPNYIYNNYYLNRISRSQFFNIWEGNTWTYIHMDVYTDENKKYYKELVNSDKNYKEKTFYSDEEIMRFRKRYVTESAEEIYNSEKISCKFNTFRGILSGQSYTHLPYYSKKKKMWINN